MSESTIPIELLSFAIVSLTLLLGLQLRIEHLREVVTRPRGLLVGLAGQFLFLPLLAVVFCYAYPTEALKTGWFILAAVPGGVLSNTFSFLGGGKLSLSMVLTACSTLAGIATIPLWTNVGLMLAGGEGATGLPVAEVLIGTFVVLVVPLSIGVGVAAWKPAFAERLYGPTRHLVLAVILISMATYVLQRWDIITRDFDIRVFFAAAIFHVVAVFGGWSLAAAFGLDTRHRFTIGIEVGFQNVVVALLVAEFLGRSDLVPFMGAYGLMMFALLFPHWALIGQRKEQFS